MNESLAISLSFRGRKREKGLTWLPPLLRRGRCLGPFWRGRNHPASIKMDNEGWGNWQRKGEKKQRENGHHMCDGGGVGDSDLTTRTRRCEQGWDGSKDGNRPDTRYPMGIWSIWGRRWDHIFTHGHLNGQESIPDGYSRYGNVPCLPVPVIRWGTRLFELSCEY